jgi:uncharacterized membrane protein (DUF485 family)
MAVGDAQTTQREQAPGTGLDAIHDVIGSDAYQRLVARRRRFTALAAGLFYALLGAFTVLAAWGHDVMATRLASGLTVGYLAAVLVIVGVWAVVWAYSRVSVRVLDPLAAEARRAEQERQAR